jgi:hypothetical protein
VTWGGEKRREEKRRDEKRREAKGLWDCQGGGKWAS